ncbi:universal stress protein A [Nitratireductor aestuarii]|uniref:Universal stress protein A n=1 Tax=Nitratireductor aestuarii TaxID=1735103 RepID=A0A916W8Y4_9HYPH|nr:universal stress protein [Nitratireductor aestuarii]GGA77747.1 universal stress protein A [Nitratireductor aestuarii]
MSIEALLPLVTYPDPADASVPANATKMVQLLGARLYALAIEVRVPEVSNALAGTLLDLSKVIKDTEAASRKRGEALLRAIAENAQSLGVKHEELSLRLLEAEFGTGAMVAARYHDVTLLGWEPDSRCVRTIAEALIFDSGRPVLLMPKTVPTAADHIAIAWDGSRVAARAVADAFRVFGSAKSASVIVVTDEKAIKDTTAADRLASYLERRGLQAEAHQVRTKGRRIGDTLQAEAKAIEADVLVMGAYGHSRLRQFVLGGATSNILDDLQLPVLLSH